MNLPKTLLLLGIAAVVAACTDDVTEPSRGASVQIEQGVSVRAAPGDTVRLSASVLDGHGQPVPGALVHWTSADTTVARVSTSGLVVAVAAGSTTVTARTASAASADVTVTVGPISKVDDRAALTALYNATGGPDWTQNDRWLTDAPLGEWYGVETDESGRVAGLNLSDNGLAGELPAKVGDLAHLQRLDLLDNDLAGKIPVEVANLASLEQLSLSGNAFTGEIPTELGDLASLERLNLSGNDLTGKIPAELGNLASLQLLDLYNNGLTGEIPAELGNLASVVELFLSVNGLTGQIPAEVGNLADLEMFSVAANSLTGEVPPELGNLASLVRMNLAGNRLTGEIPATLDGLADLQEMYWNRNAGLCAPGTRRFIDFAEELDRTEGPFCHEADADVLKSLYSWTGGASWRSSTGWLQSGPLSDWHGVVTDSVAGRVVALDLSDNGLSGALSGSFSSLEALRELRVDGNSDLDGRLLLTMTALSLRVLQYDGTGLCTPSEPSFRSWLQSIASHTGTGVECPPPTDREVLETLYRSTGGPTWFDRDNWLTDSPLEDWYGVLTDEQGRVTALRMGSNALAGQIPPELGNLDNLVELGLADNRLTGQLPPELGNLDKLRGLIVYSNSLTGEIPPELGNLGALEVLALSANDLTGEIPPELGNLDKLRGLIVYGNSLTGEIPPELGNLDSLQWLDVYGNGLTGEIPPELGDLDNLVELFLSYNGLTGEVPVELGNLASLQGLFLSYNSLTGEIPPELGGLAHLEWLEMSGNDLTGNIPSELGGLGRLQRLDLSYNATLSGRVPAALASLERLSELKLGGTGLCAPGDDAAFQSWLRSIPLRRVEACAEQAGGEAAAAAYIVQTVQSFAFPVPLVAGKSGLLRVFASVPEAGDARAPTARATFYLPDGTERTIEVPSGAGRLSAEPREGSLGASANVEVPGDVLRPGVEMVVEVDPGGVLDPALGVPNRIPATGRTALDVHEMPSFDVTVVPFLWETDPDSSILDMTRDAGPKHPLFEETQRLLPVGAMSVNVHEPVWSSSRNAGDLLEETEAIRTMESGDGYWMGTLPNATGAAGVAWVPGRSMFSVPYSSVVAHEFGHNLHLFHAPCGGAAGPDPAFPSDRGHIGAWGWDRRSGRLVPAARVDLMTYCEPAWIGDYHFANSFRWRLSHEAEVAAFAGPPTRVLLLWGGADANGRPFLNPAFVVDARASLPDAAGEWRIVGEAEDGRALFDRRFAMRETADGNGRSSFVFALPTEAGWADALARIVLTGPGGSAELDATSGPAAALLLDASTGRVRGILRDWPESAAQADAARAAPEPGLEVQVSRGVPAPVAWQR